MTPNLKARIERRDNLLPQLHAWVAHLRLTGRRADSAVPTLARWLEVSDDALRGWLRATTPPRLSSLAMLESWLAKNPCPAKPSAEEPVSEQGGCLPGLSPLVEPAPAPTPHADLALALTEAERLKEELVVLGTDLALSPLQRMAFNGLHARAGRFVRYLGKLSADA